MENYQVIQGDILEWALDYNGPPFHAILSDPPYNLKSIRRRFGSSKAKAAKPGSDGAFERQSRGFMGQQWDTDIAHRSSTWEALIKHLHPGGFILSFSHGRTQHRLACALEDAGLEIKSALYNYRSNVPAQLGWIYGSGKAMATRTSLFTDDPAWVGHYHGSPLAPEIEPILVAQKIWSGRTIDNIQQTGAGTLNIQRGKQQKTGGRFPGTLILSHHPACQLIGEKEVKNTSGSLTGQEHSRPHENGIYGEMNGRLKFKAYGKGGKEKIPDYLCHPDCHIPKMEIQAGGNKAHFFLQADWSLEVMEQLADAAPVYYAGKVLNKERNAGLQGLPKQLRHRVNAGGIERDPAWAPTWQENNHPTLKPVLLTKWLASLLLPPKEYAPRRILVPFAGTGREMIGALLAGWDEIVGIEINPEYCQLADKALPWWAKWVEYGQTDPQVILKIQEDKQQLEMQF